jgi:hypothetical protein
MSLGLLKKHVVQNLDDVAFRLGARQIPGGSIAVRRVRSSGRNAQFGYRLTNDPP